MSWSVYGNQKCKSLVWQHFKISSTGSCTKCDHCNAVLTFRGGTTSNLLNHLTAKHYDVTAVARFIAAKRRMATNKTQRLMWVSSR